MIRATLSVVEVTVAITLLVGFIIVGVMGPVPDPATVPRDDSSATPDPGGWSSAAGTPDRMGCGSPAGEREAVRPVGFIGESDCGQPEHVVLFAEGQPRHPAAVLAVHTRSPGGTVPETVPVQYERARRQGFSANRSALQPLSRSQLARALERARDNNKRVLPNPSQASSAPNEGAAEEPEQADQDTPLVMELPDWYIPAAEMTRDMEARRSRIRRCLEFYYGRPLHTLEDSPWSMMHHMLAWGVDSHIVVGRAGGRRASTIAWLCGNGVCDGERLLSVKDGELRARIGPGLQGHDGQFLALLAQARVGRAQEIVVDGQSFRVENLIEREMRTCRPRTELTFKLIGLAHYEHTEQTWQDAQGNEWSIPRLIQEEIQQPINGATCGGTHRLMGLTYAVLRRQLDGLPVTGQFERARKFTAAYQNYAFKMQFDDGSFSSDYFRSRASWGDLNRRLKTSGHILEWLVFSLPHERLQDVRVRRAVDYICNLLTQNRYFDWDNGPLGHSIRALSLYDERVFGGKPGERQFQLATSPPLHATPDHGRMRRR